MDTQPIIERLRTIATSAVEASGIELVHVEMAGTKRDQVVRVYIDKEGGVTLDDCSRVSQKIEAVLDAEDLIPARYVLEVSSPGIERQLYSLSDFARFAGKLARIRTKTELNGQKTFSGRIREVDGERIVFDDRTAGEVTIDYADIERANLKIDLAEEFGTQR
jgi:ribosome maturation factor RimP